MPEYCAATYNIHRCIGTDGLYQPERIRQVLHRLNADIIALQEVESGADHGDLLEYFVEGTNWQYIEGPALHRESGRYGNAILTSLPVVNQRLVEISYRSRETRGAIDLYLQHRENNIRVIATHLGLSGKERRYQSRMLMQLLEEPLKENIDITLLMGDMNEWLPWSRTLCLFHNYFGHSHYIASYPTRWSLLALDRIWIKPHSRLKEISHADSTRTRFASDHLPIRAKFIL